MFIRCICMLILFIGTSAFCMEQPEEKGLTKSKSDEEVIGSMYPSFQVHSASHVQDESSANSIQTDGQQTIRLNPEVAEELAKNTIRASKKSKRKSVINYFGLSNERIQQIVQEDKNNKTNRRRSNSIDSTMRPKLTKKEILPLPPESENSTEQSNLRYERIRRTKLSAENIHSIQEQLKKQQEHHAKELKEKNKESTLTRTFSAPHLNVKKSEVNSDNNKSHQENSQVPAIKIDYSPSGLRNAIKNHDIEKAKLIIQKDPTFLNEKVAKNLLKKESLICFFIDQYCKDASHATKNMQIWQIIKQYGTIISSKNYQKIENIIEEQKKKHRDNIKYQMHLNFLLDSVKENITKDPEILAASLKITDRLAKMQQQEDLTSLKLAFDLFSINENKQKQLEDERQSLDAQRTLQKNSNDPKIKRVLHQKDEELAQQEKEIKNFLNHGYKLLLDVTFFEEVANADDLPAHVRSWISNNLNNEKYLEHLKQLKNQVSTNLEEKKEINQVIELKNKWLELIKSK